MKDNLLELIKRCNELNYNFSIQFYDGEFNIYVDDNNVNIDKEIACCGGYDLLDKALEQILKMI